MFIVTNSNTAIIEHSTSNLLIGEINSYKNLTNIFHFPKTDIVNELSTNYWGPYNLFSITDAGLKVFVPQCGQKQIFYFETDEYVIFSSEMLFFRNFTSLTFNEEYLKIFLLSGDFLSHVTPFNNIYEIIMGCEINFSASSTTSEFIWTFSDHLNPKFTTNHDAQLEIKNNFNLVINTILNRHENIFLDLSGGLDSSSIMLELCRNKNTRHKIYGINLSDTSVNSSNEIEHVKKLQESTDFELIQLDYNQCLPFSKVNDSILPNKPSIILSHIKYQQILNEAAFSRHHKYCFVNGHGGDSVFNCPPMIGAIADLFKDNKLWRIPSKVHELALQYRKSIWHIYINNINIWLKHKLRLQNPLLRHRVPVFPFFSKINKKSFPLFHQLGTLNYPSEYPYCLVIHLTLANMHANLRSKNHNIYYPFMSQPILETGLKINSYDSFTAKYDRYLFRQAMGNQYNNSCLWRTDKGHTTGVFHKALSKNRDYLLDLCCNGFLITNGFVDKKQFLILYDRTASGIVSQQWALFNFMCLEIFINMWKNYI